MSKPGKFSPGPWTFESVSFGSPDAPISHKKIVAASVNGEVGRNMIAEVHMNHPNHEADGQLLAASPELYEALYALRQFGFNVAGNKMQQANLQNWYELADKALAKARGESS